MVKPPEQPVEPLYPQPEEAEVVTSIPMPKDPCPEIEVFDKVAKTNFLYEKREPRSKILKLQPVAESKSENEAGP